MSEVFCSKEGLVTKATDRESYRLWFEFLKRALADPTVKVKTEIYESWGDFQSLSFESWWRKTGAKITALESRTFVELINEIPNESSDLFIRVPTSITVTQALNQIKVLLSHVERPQAKTQVPLKIREGAEIRHAAFRAYLVTYDAYVTLSNRNHDKRVYGAAVLDEVRLLYEMRQVQFISGVSAGVKTDPMPSSLYGERGTSTKADKDSDKQAIATVLRYLKKAQDIIKNVAEGRFPD